jgi:hypothetical protein
MSSTIQTQNVKHNPLFFFRTFEVIIYKHAEENVILVNEHDEQIGLPKLEAHQKLFASPFFCFLFKQSK